MSISRKNDLFVAMFRKIICSGAVCAFIVLGGCGTIRTNPKKFDDTKAMRSRVPSNFIAAVHFVPGRAKGTYALNDQHGRTFWVLREGLQLVLASRDVTDAVFGKAVRFTGTSTQHIILKVDGEFNIDAKTQTHTSNVHVKLFNQQGTLLTTVHGKSVVHSSFVMDEDAIYNAYANALNAALKDAFKKDSPFAKALSTFGQAQKYSPGKDADIGALLDKSAVGTGFFINDQGEMVTNHHVIKNCAQLFSQVGETHARAELRVKDEEQDLAVLKIPDVPNAKFASFAKDPQLQIGQTVVTLGYPLQGLLTSSPTLSTGIVSALAGPHDIKELFQHSAPVQPGSSGGPVIDEDGNVVGIVVGSLSTVMLARATGAIPQNLNFAIQGHVVQQFLTEHKVKHVTRQNTRKALAATELASQASNYTVQVFCLQ